MCQTDVSGSLWNDFIPRVQSGLDEVPSVAFEVLSAGIQPAGIRRGPAFVWGYEPGPADLPEPQTASTSPASVALSKDLRKQGWKFVGPTTVYAFMQAMGQVDDHTKDCVIRPEVELARETFTW